MDEPASLEPPFDRSYWVEPGRLLAGCYPSPAEAETLGSAVSLVIDLTEADERRPYADDLEGAAWRRLPIADFSTPSRAEMTRILDAIDGELARGGAVYVHCGAGRGRTGMVVGCHLVRGGLAPDEALARLAELRADLRDALEPSPETPEQVALVREWRAGS